MTGHVPSCTPPCEDWPLCRHREPTPEPAPAPSRWDRPVVHLVGWLAVLAACTVLLAVTR